MVPLTLGFFFASVAAGVWFWLTCLIGLVWLRRHLDLNNAHREPLLTEADADGNGEDLPELSVLVAAKDEESNIGRCVAGLLRQNYPRFRLIVIDDRSTDATPRIIDELAERDPRVSALHIKELPAGWFGKNNAMRVGVENAEGQWLCFSDADCSFESEKLLTAAVRFATREKVEFLSVLPRLRAESFWERVVQPVAGGVLVFWYPPQRVNDPRSSVAYANGAFMLLSRAGYDRLGGHDAVKATLNEDMHLARRAKANGVSLRVIRSADLYSVRMYTGIKAIWRGWSRIFFGCFGTLPRLIGSLALLSIASLSPYVSLLFSWAAGPDAGWIAAAAAFAIACQQSVLWRFYPVSGLQAGWALTYPLGALFCIGMTLNAITRVGGAVQTNWRGTVYRRGG